MVISVWPITQLKIILPRKEKVYKLEIEAEICKRTLTSDNPISILFESHENSQTSKLSMSVLSIRCILVWLAIFIAVQNEKKCNKEIQYQ